MAKFTIETKVVTVGGQQVAVRALTARERQAISKRCSSGEEMTSEAVLMCTSELPGDGEVNGKPFFADLSEVLDAPCGHIARLGEEILTLSGMDVGSKENPT